MSILTCKPKITLSHNNEPLSAPVVSCVIPQNYVDPDIPDRIIVHPSTRTTHSSYTISCMVILCVPRHSKVFKDELVLTHCRKFFRCLFFVHNCAYKTFSTSKISQTMVYTHNILPSNTVICLTALCSKSQSMAYTYMYVSACHK